MVKKTLKKALKKATPIKKKVVKEVKKVEELPKQEYKLTIGIKDLFNAGCHLGHKVSKTHPRARVNIYTAKDGIEIINLEKTIEALQNACNIIYNARKNGKNICLVGTKRQAKEVVKRVALASGVPYVTERWLGGTITNWEQIRKNIKRLKELKEGISQGKFAESSKKEQVILKKEIVRLERIVGGLENTEKLFDILVVVDPGFEKTAVREAALRRIKTVAIVDTDSDPTAVDLAVPSNDDNVKAISIIVEEIGRAIKSA